MDASRSATSNHPFPSPAGALTLETLMREEDAQLCAAHGGEAQTLQISCSTPSATDEPWVAFTNRDRVGLALSGGGIRSAIFNLGLLQSLRHFGVLRHVDYLSTVSGGGYIGGFWTGWKLRSDATETRHDASGTPVAAPMDFPHRDASELSNPEPQPPDRPAVREVRECGEIRHLREFSRFLMPRLSLDSVDFWNGVVAVLGGMIPSLMVAASVLWLGWIAWLCTRFALGGGALEAATPFDALSLVKPASFFVLALIVHGVSELKWCDDQPPDSQETKGSGAIGWGVLLSLIAAVSLATLPLRPESIDPGDLAQVSANRSTSPLISSLAEAGSQVTVQVRVDRQGSSPKLATTNPSSSHHRRLTPNVGWLAPAIGWLVAAMAGVLLRFLILRNDHGFEEVPGHRALDRAIARCLAPAILWASLTGLWWVATRGIDLLGLSATASNSSLAIAGGGAAGVFGWLRDWLGSEANSGKQVGILDRLKPILPQLAANLAVMVGGILSARLLLLVLEWTNRHQVPFHYSLPALFLSVLAFLGLLVWLLNPAQIGLHEFYRSRISRCFLGATNPDRLKGSRSQESPDRRTAGTNRQTLERPNDDFSLGRIREQIRSEMEQPGNPSGSSRLAPIHLVCCAANNLAGDQLGTLYRGARSAVVSARGISLGNATIACPKLRFSAALTASAAAFNSNMGGVSQELGPAVAFLACALNLRLGLWVPDPRSGNQKPERIPGLRFLAEMAGQTISDNSREKRRHKLRTGDWLHLSDGGHFENFGLYELLRRHCRYLIVSDCGADPASTFDDFARLARRVREDFGIEIDIDLSPLTPGSDGFAGQHLVVGTIHYDGVAGADKGTLLFFKPVLTGDEPADVLQYRVTNSEFPQQTTADQFYDEPQWESYRRLGEHAAKSAFRFLEDRPRDRRANPVDTLFHQAALQWLSGIRETDENRRALSERASTFEGEFRREAPAWMRLELFPEVGNAAGDGHRDAGEEASAVVHLLTLVELMEDIWQACALEQQWSHPMNQGWMAWLRRWSSMPSFRQWWPILKSNTSYGFGKFVQLRLGLSYNEEEDRHDAPHSATPQSAGLRLRPFAAADQDCLTALRWQQHFGSPFSADQAIGFVYELLPSMAPNETAAPIPVGLVRVELQPAPSLTPGFHWFASHLFVAPALEGSGFIGRFLRALVAELTRQDPKASLWVTLSDDAVHSTGQIRTDAGSRARRVQVIEFYKSQGFTLAGPAAENAPVQLCLDRNLVKS